MQIVEIWRNILIYIQFNHWFQCKLLNGIMANKYFAYFLEYDFVDYVLCSMWLHYEIPISHPPIIVSPTSAPTWEGIRWIDGATTIGRGRQIHMRTHAWDVPLQEKPRTTHAMRSPTRHC